MGLRELNDIHESVEKSVLRDTQEMQCIIDISVIPITTTSSNAMKLSSD